MPLVWELVDTDETEVWMRGRKVVRKKRNRDDEEDDAGLLLRSREVMDPGVARKKTQGYIIVLGLVAMLSFGLLISGFSASARLVGLQVLFVLAVGGVLFVKIDSERKARFGDLFCHMNEEGLLREWSFGGQDKIKFRLRWSRVKKMSLVKKNDQLYMIEVRDSKKKRLEGIFMAESKADVRNAVRKFYRNLAKARNWETREVER